MAPASEGPNGKKPPFGRAVIRRSNDGGRTWSSTVSVIATDSQSRFAANPAIPAAARLVPWDGASGVVDRETGDIFVASGYPAPPGGAAHSQRFFARSTDHGRTWGPIRALGAVKWPERWDGHLAAAHGELAESYIADDVPVAHTPCPCVVFGTSMDGGRAFTRHYLVSVRNIDTLVHYPPVAADPIRKGVFALALVSDDARQVFVWISADNGDHWTQTQLDEPADITKTSRPALAYAPDGTLVAMWRGYHADGSFDVYAAAAPDGRHFNAAMRLSTESSRTPGAMLTNYAVRGDFINSVAADDRFVHAAWTDWRSGAEARVYYGRLPMRLLLAPVR
ncbi:MAG: sialidase family protein [Steroidobacteraceae bacterium]